MEKTCNNCKHDGGAVECTACNGPDLPEWKPREDRKSVIVPFTDSEYRALLATSSLWGQPPSEFIREIVNERTSATQEGRKGEQVQG